METNVRLAAFRVLINQPLANHLTGLSGWLGGILRVVEEGRIVTEYVVREDMINPMQVLHGGTASAILDDICGLTVLTLGREYGFTSVNLVVDFLNAARLGETLTAEAQVVRAGRNIIHVTGQITNLATGKLIAKCSTNLVQTSVKMG